MEVVFKSAIFTTSVSLTIITSRNWASHTIDIISMCTNYEIFVHM